jgi:hypothetical protein
VVFYTKPNVSPNGPLAPRITIDITLPDGRTFEKFLDTSPELFNASKSTCDTLYLSRADTRYVVSFEREKTILQAILTARAPRGSSPG